MAVEKPTDAQIAKAQASLQECKITFAQTAAQHAIDAAKYAKDQLDKASQTLSAIPEQAIGQLNEAIALLLSIINGYKNTNSSEFDPNAVIAKLQALINPVISALASLPIPEIPGLSTIQKLLTALTKLLSMESNGNDVKYTMAELPPELMSTLNDLLAALMSLCATLPLVLINLVFQMIDTIVGLFKQIAGIIGVPSIPYPLTLVPQCISMMPDLMKFMMNVPGQLMDATYATLKRAYGKITSLQFPDFPDSINIPSMSAPCPKRNEADAASGNQQVENPFADQPALTGELENFTGSADELTTDEDNTFRMLD